MTTTRPVGGGGPTSCGEIASPAAPGRLLSNWLDAGYASLDAEGRILALNAPLAKFLGVPAANAAPGKFFWQLLVARVPEWQEEINACAKVAEDFTATRLPLPGAEPRPWFALEIVRHPQGCVVRLNSALPPPDELAEGPWDESLQNPAAQRAMFMRLLHAETQLENLMQRWPGVIFSQHANFGFDFVSPRIGELTGIEREQWRQQPNLFWQVIHESDLAELRKQIKAASESPNGASTTFRIRNLQTGRVTYVLEHRQAIKARNGLVLGYEGMWLDVTRQTIAEKRLSSAAWKETIAVLTMGLAHDFSNVMAGIHSLSESFLTQIEAENPFREGLGLIRQNSLQASQLVQRIINLHHGKVGERNYHDFNEIVTDLAELTRKIIPRRIEVKIDLATQSLPIYMDAVECRQVIINLALNAADAMPQKGVLAFGTSLHEEFPPLGQIQGALPRLPAICLSVQDNGCGIEPRHLTSIFEPFFTTKAMDKGSGLGLYNARLFIEKQHGAISVDSTVGKGTTFKLWLPMSDFTEGDRELEAAATERRRLIVAGAAGKPLDNMVEFLRLRNYHVAVAHTRAQALELMRLNEYPYVALLAQVDGKDEHFGALVAEVRAQRLPLKTILQIVGRNEDELDAHLLRRADLILSSDLSQETIAQQLTTLFEPSAAR